MESTYLDRQAVQELFAGAEQGESPQWRGLPAYKGRRRFSGAPAGLICPASADLEKRRDERVIICARRLAAKISEFAKQQLRCAPVQSLTLYSLLPLYNVSNGRTQKTRGQVTALPTN